MDTPLKKGETYQYFSLASNRTVEVTYEPRENSDGYHIFRRIDTLDEVWVRDLSVISKKS
jgi:hypothetical protein